MGDLILQGFRDVPRKRLVKILSEEKRRMFGEQKLLVKKEGEGLLCSRVSIRTLGNLRKELN
jgi:hypothetical protein